MGERKETITSWLIRGDFKPCPFCGGESVAMTSSNGFTSVGCLKCNPPFGVMMQGDYPSVMERWNTRAGEQRDNKEVSE